MKKPFTGVVFALCMAVLGGCLNFGTAPGGTEGEGLTGILINSQGQPAANVKVLLYPVQTSLSKRTDGAHVDSVYTNAQGKFDFKKLVKAKYNVAASAKRGDTVFSVFVQNIQYTGGTYDLGMRALELTGGITLFIHIEQGGSVDSVSCTIPNSPYTGFSTFIANYCTVKGVPSGTYQVEVSAPGYLPTLVNASPVLPGDNTLPGSLDPLTIDLVSVEAPPKPATQYFQSRPTTLGLWTFNEGTTQVFQDASGKRNTMLSSTAVSSISSPYGSAVSLNGAGLNANDTGLNLTGRTAITYEARVRLTSYPSINEPNSLAHLMGIYGVLSVNIGHNGRIQALVQIGETNSWAWYGGETPAGAVPLNEWVNIAVAADKATRMVYAYINDEAVLLYTPTGPPAGTKLRESLEPGSKFTLGNLGSPSFTGFVEEVRVSAGMVLGTAPTMLIAPYMEYNSSYTIPAAPRLTIPSHAAQVSSPVGLAWDSVVQAGLYRVEVATDSLFAPSSRVVVDSMRPKPFLVLPVNLPDGAYYWRVRAKNSAGVGNFSAVRGFVVGNRSWSPVASGATNTILDIHFPSASVGYITGGGITVLKTTDGGISWTNKSGQPLVDANAGKSIFFQNNDTGWVTGGFDGSYSGLVKTTNGGTTWTRINIASTHDLFTVHFVGRDTGWVVGTAGTVFKTVDGGNNWSPQNAGSNDWVSCHFVNGTTGFVGGSSGIIRGTTNGGATWTTRLTSNSGYIWNIHFPNNTTGYATGYDGTIYKTANGGVTWVAQSTGVSSPLRSIHFVDANVGTATGDGGVVLSTTNGGTVWKREAVGTSNTLGAVFMFSPQRILTGGDGGVLFWVQGSQP